MTSVQRFELTEFISDISDRMFGSSCEGQINTFVHISYIRCIKEIKSFCMNIDLVERKEFYGLLLEMIFNPNLLCHIFVPTFIRLCFNIEHQVDIAGNIF